MDNFKNFVSHLTSIHQPFIEQSTTETLAPSTIHVEKNNHSVPLSICNDKWEIIDNNKIYSLYDSLLSILCQKYMLTYTFDEKKCMIDEFIRFIIKSLELNPILKNLVKRKRYNQSRMMDDIKNKVYQSDNIIFILSIIFDINIIVVQMNHVDQIEVYYNDQEYDTCKPNVLVGRDEFNYYRAIIYDDTPLLMYHENDIIKQLFSNTNKKEFNLLNY